MIASSLGAGAVISRLWFLEPEPFYTDSWHILKGITETGVAHPPGYIGYVMTARVMGWIFGSPHAGMLALNLLALFIIAAMLYLFGRRFSGSTPGSSALMTLLFLANPLSFYYSDVSLSFITEAMTALVTALFCWEAMRGKRWATFASAAALALGASVRQTLLVFLLPLWISVHLIEYWPNYLLRSRGEACLAPTVHSLRPLILGVLLMIPLVLVWIIPTIILYKAQGGYSEELRRQMADAVWANSIFIKGFRGLAKNGAKLFFYILWGLNAAILLYFVKPARDYFKQLWLNERQALVFLSLWIIPSFTFYLFIFMGPPGYIFVFLPALYLPLAGALQSKTTRLAIAAAIIGALLFLLPGPLPDSVRSNRLANVIFLKYNAAGIKAQDSRNLQNLDSVLPRDYGGTNRR